MINSEKDYTYNFTQESNSQDNVDEGKYFIKKWLRRIVTDFKNSLSLNNKNNEEDLTAKQREAFSLKVASFLNLLNIPFFWSGILLFIWLFIDYLFDYTLPVDLYQRIEYYSKPLTTVIGPAVVGYWTNWLAIKMLFHPRHNNAVWWGLVHARREDLIESISEGILSSLISPEIVRDYLDNHGLLADIVNSFSQSVDGMVQEVEFRKELRDLLFDFLSELVNNEKTVYFVEEYLNDLIQEWTGDGFSGKMMEWTKSIWASSIKKKVLEALPEFPKIVDYAFPQVEAFLQSIPLRIEQEGAEMESVVVEIIAEGLRSLDLKDVIKGQLGKMDAAELEKLLTSNISGELVFIQTSGGIFGFLVGLAMIYPVLRLIFLGCGLLIWVVYRVTREV